MIMKFKIKRDTKALSGKMSYLKKEHSFYFEPIKSTDITVLVKDLNLDFDSSTMKALDLYGYHPDCGSWIRKEVTSSRE